MNQKSTEHSILKNRVDLLYKEFNEFYNNPEFSDYTKEDAFSMFLIRRIATLELYCESIASFVNSNYLNDK